MSAQLFEHMVDFAADLLTCSQTATVVWDRLLNTCIHVDVTRSARWYELFTLSTWKQHTQTMGHSI